MIEKQIEELTAALIDNTKALRELASGSTTAATPAAEAPKVERKKKEPAAPAAEPLPAVAGPTIVDIRNAAQAVANANDQDATPLVALAKEFGVKRLTEAPADRFPEMLVKLQKLAADLTKKSANNAI